MQLNIIRIFATLTEVRPESEFAYKKMNFQHKALGNPWFWANKSVFSIPGNVDSLTAHVWPPAGRVECEPGVQHKLRQTPVIVPNQRVAALVASWQQWCGFGRIRGMRDQPPGSESAFNFKEFVVNFMKKKILLSRVNWHLFVSLLLFKVEFRLLPRSIAESEQVFLPESVIFATAGFRKWTGSSKSNLVNIEFEKTWKKDLNT